MMFYHPSWLVVYYKFYFLLVTFCLNNTIISLLNMESLSEKYFKLGMVAKKILENNKGILAADESANTIQKRFENCEIINNEETRRKFREFLFTTERLEKYIGGVILHEETFNQNSSSGKKLVDLLIEKDICVGIKLDKGLNNFNGSEKISVGIEDLDLRIPKFTSQGAVFAKWRSLFLINNNSVTEDCIIANCNVLAQYAKICQNNGIVPIVEPELFFEGDFTIDIAEKQTKIILSSLIQKLNNLEVYIPAVIIKMSFVTEGRESNMQSCPTEVANRTMEALISAVPCGIPGIVFLSGGHSKEDSIEYLNSINISKSCRTWTLSFSYGRGLTEEPMKIWAGKDENIDKAKEALLKTAYKCHLSCKGEGKSK